MLSRQQVISGEDTVGDVMTGWVITVRSSESLLAARDLMTKNHVSQLVVTDERNRSIGFISKRSIARFLLEDPTKRRLEEISIPEGLTESIPTLRLPLPVLNAARLFDTENLTYTAVTNDDPLAGIMTETDLCNYFSRKFPKEFKVSELMTRDFIFAKSNYPALHVASAIIFRQSSVPVIDEELVGILTLSDILSIRDRIPISSLERSKPNPGSDWALTTTKDLMTSKPITTIGEMDLAQAAQILINKGISSLPVIDYEKSVVGLLTKHDIVRALGRIGTKPAPET
jgi:CBS domain-containing protein